MSDSAEVDQIAKALAAFQKDMPVLPKGRTAKIYGKGGTRTYNYADISDVLSAALPVLSKHGLAVIQMTLIDGDNLKLRTKVIHTSGQWVEGLYPVAEVTSDHQRMGASMTYARRYAICAALGVASDEDVDGEDAATSAPSRPPARPPEKREPVVAFSSAESTKTTEWLLDKIAAITDRAGLVDFAADTAEMRAKLRADDHALVKEAYLEKQSDISRGASSNG